MVTRPINRLTRSHSLRSKYLQLPKIAAAAACRRITARTEQMSRLVVQPKRLHRRHQPTPTTPRNQHRLLPHLAGKSARQGMLEQIENSLRITRKQRTAETIQKRQHKHPVVFGVMYTL